MENSKSFFNNLHDEKIDYIFQFLWEISRVFTKKFKSFLKKKMQYWFTK